MNEENILYEEIQLNFQVLVPFSLPSSIHPTYVSFHSNLTKGEESKRPKGKGEWNEEWWTGDGGAGRKAKESMFNGMRIRGKNEMRNGGSIVM